MIQPWVRVVCDGKDCKTEPLAFEGAIVPPGELHAAGWLTRMAKLAERGIGEPITKTPPTQHFCPSCQVNLHAEAHRR